MQNTLKLGAASLTLAALMSGCAPVPTTETQTGATYDASGAPASSGYTAPATTNNYYNQPPAAGNDYSGGNYGGATATYNGGGSTDSSYYDYSAPTGSSGGYSGSTYSGGNSYSSGGNPGSSYSGGGSYSSGNAGGSYAVQVVASSSRSTAENMQRQMQSMGYSAVVDPVGGLYKVRIPFSSEGEAKSALGRIRSTVPDAFFTMR